MRTAVYARFSSDLQRQTSLNDQIGNCREHAQRHSWDWQDAQVYTDAGISGASIEGRPGLQALIAAATQVPRPFDVLLVDDSSRVSRDLADALRIVQRLKFAGVRVIYISQGIDSDSEQHETLIAVHGLVDGLYLREMAAKIKRGLKGQLNRGFATGGKTYGYRSVSVANEDGSGPPLGYRLEIVPIEAAAIRRIFEWYADGISVPQIVTRLIQQGHPAPRKGRGVWRVGAVKNALRNPKYLGRLVWGRYQIARRPGSRTRVGRPVPEAQWQTLDRPELRIIADDLWERVQVRRREADSIINKHRQPGTPLLRGKNAKLYSPTLFSGLMTCGECGKAINVCGSRRINGVHYAYYGCAFAQKNGPLACSNNVKVRVQTADRMLLAGLQSELLKPETLDYVSGRLAAALNELVDRRPEQRDALKQAKAEATQKLRYLVAAVEAGGGAATLFHAIKAREGEIRALDGQLAALAEPIEQRLAVVPTWVAQQLKDAAGLLSEVPERAKTQLQRLGISFKLHPVRNEGDRPFLRAIGGGNFEQLAFAPYSLPTSVALVATTTATAAPESGHDSGQSRSFPTTDTSNRRSAL